VAAIGVGVLLTREPPDMQLATATRSGSVALTPVPVRPAAPPARGGTTGGSPVPEVNGSGKLAMSGDEGEAPAAARTRTVEARKTRAAAAASPGAPATGDGYVALAVSPWGEVVVNGATRGVSPPLTRLTLPPGVHAVEIRNGAAPPLLARVEVKPGQTVALQHRF
jgi:eukaryotic-like serine/threonine-protein kinase